MSKHTKETQIIKPSDIHNSIIITDSDNQNKKGKPTLKRGRRIGSSPESTPLPPSKIKTTIIASSDKAVTIDMIRMLLNEQTESLKTSIGTDMKSLGNELKTEFQAKINQLNEKIDANQDNVQKQINEIQAKVTQCIEQKNDTDDDFLKRLTKLNELKISGIAYRNNENLVEIFSEIAKLVQFNLNNLNNVPSLIRTYKWNKTTNTNTPTSIVIVKFIATHIRNDFYRLYLNKIATKQPITSDNIGLPSISRIIIGESLTTKNFEIFVAAGKQKKENNLCQVFTQDGLVHVKAIKSSYSIIKGIGAIFEIQSTDDEPNN